MSRLGDVLERRCRELGVPFDPRWVKPVGTHLDLLARWAQAINLTSVSTPDEALERHVVDSLSLLRLDAVRTGPGPAADLGSGAGFPGLPLALARPDLEWTLIEPRRKRGVFLTHVIGSAGIPNARWVEARAPDPRLPSRFLLVTSRATLPVPELLEAADSLLAPGGVLAVMATTPQEHPGWEAQQVVDDVKIGGVPRWIAALVRAG